MTLNQPRILPTPGSVLRDLITASGYRRYLVDKGLDKDLDDMAEEKRPSSNFELLRRVQTEWMSAIRMDCGADWSNLIAAAWEEHSEFLRKMAREIDTTVLFPVRAKDVLHRGLLVAEICAFAGRVSRELPLLDAQTCWDKPFVAWLQMASGQAGVTDSELLDRLANHLSVDQRTLGSWKQGRRFGKELWPYRNTIEALLPEISTKYRQVDRLTGWLVLVVVIQSLPVQLRDSAELQYQKFGQPSPKTTSGAIRDGIYKELRESVDIEGLNLRRQVTPVQQQLEQLFENALSNSSQIQVLLAKYRDRFRNHRSEHLWLWWSARLAAHLGEEKSALDQYAEACKLAWWRVGPEQFALLREALCYAVGVAKKKQADHYWDRCYRLGLNE